MDPSAEFTLTSKKNLPDPHNKSIIKPQETLLRLTQLIKANPKTFTKFTINGLPQAPQKNPQKMNISAKTAQLLQHNKSISNLFSGVVPYRRTQFEISIIQNCQQVTSLYLKINTTRTCTPFHLKSLSIIISGFKRLTSLTIDFPTLQEITPQHIASLFFALIRLKSLTSLSLNFFYVNERRDAPSLQVLSSYLSRFSQLKSLSFNIRASNIINSAALSFYAPALKKLVSLQTLDLRLDCHPIVPNQAILDFFSGIQDRKTLTSLSLDLAGCELDDCRVDFEPVSVGLSLLSTPLKTFKFRGYHYLEENALSAISRVLREKFSLENLSLDLRDNHMISDRGISDLASALQSFHSLSSLQLDLSRESRDYNLSISAQLIGSSIKSLTNLKVLDLNLSNRILDNGQFNFLADSLEGLTSLRQLSLKVALQSATDKDFEVFTNHMKNLKGLSSLILDFADTEKLNNESIINLGSALKNIVQLRNLGVTIGSILNSDKQIPESLAMALQNLPFLTSVTLNLHHYSLLEGEEASCVLIFKALGQLKFLKKVVLELPIFEGHTQAEEVYLKHVQEKKITWTGDEPKENF